MNKIKIYVDHYGADEDFAFAKRLKERIKSIKYDFDLVTWSDTEGDGDDWERETINQINSSTIVIPIISSDYISYVSKSVEASLDNIIDSKDRFLFPILFKPAEWGGFKWIVRSKLIPSDEQPLNERPGSDIDAAINSLVKTITNILAKLTEPAEINKKTDRSLNDNNGFIFISHDHDDADFAELLKLKLEKNNLTGWIDSERLKIGQDWREEIDSGIENALAVIAIMTPEARKSEYVTYEWAFSWGKGKKIFPIMLKQTQLHPRLESLQYLDFTNRTTRPWDDLINSLRELA